MEASSWPCIGYLANGLIEVHHSALHNYEVQCEVNARCRQLTRTDLRLLPCRAHTATMSARDQVFPNRTADSESAGRLRQCTLWSRAPRFKLELACQAVKCQLFVRTSCSMAARIAGSSSLQLGSARAMIDSSSQKNIHCCQSFLDCFQGIE